MALPVLGLRVRLKGGGRRGVECGYAATFVDGSSPPAPCGAGEPCESESLARMESFQSIIRRDEGRGGRRRLRANRRRRRARRQAGRAPTRPTGLI